ncbi:MAG: alpha/beta hydrolase [Verrucomicrobiota bacterium]
MRRYQENRLSRLSLLSCAGLALMLSARLLLGGQATPAWVTAMRTYPPVMPDSRVESYKTIGPTNLQLYIFAPKDHAATNHRPAIVFFFGGGWTSGSPQQFEKACQYFASRGMVAITADYRVASRQGAKPVQCVADAKSAIRWLRRSAARLGIDPDRIVASGGSAGGQLAACAALVPGLDEPGEDTSVSATPNAAVLFNPVLVLGPLDGQTNASPGSRFTAKQLGVEPQQLSPGHHIRPGEPPMIIFHGRADAVVPFATAEAFAAKMKAAGNRCELVGFDGQGHGFFNYGFGDNAFFLQTVKRADEFLASLGYLSGPPQVEKFLKP